MPRITFGTIVKILIASLIVGLLLTWLNVDPTTLLNDLVGLARDLFEWSVSVLGDAMTYMVVGAVVVVPLWGITYLWRMLRGRR